MKKLATMNRAYYKPIVQPEDTALQGCNRSAALNSNTAGRSGSIELLWPATCGFDPKAKNPRGFGGLVPQGNKQTNTKTRPQLRYAARAAFQFTLNQYSLAGRRRY